MRINNFGVNRLSVLALLCCVLSAPSASAELLDFAGWDHRVIANGGQTFTDICGTLDVTVRSVGAFDADSTFGTTMTGGTSAIRSEHRGAGSNSFVFSFSEPIDVYVDFTRLDTQELLGVFGQGLETYAHHGGNTPTSSAFDSGMRLQGNGYAAMAADGRVTAGPTSVLTVTYGATLGTVTKYQDFNIGKIAVPEPSSFGLFGLALLLAGRSLRSRVG